MKFTKKYTAFKIEPERVNRSLEVKIGGYGNIVGPYYDEIEPNTEFDTEQAAIESCYEQDRHSTWAIIPIVKFERE